MHVYRIFTHLLRSWHTPVQQFDPIAAPTGKDKQMTGKRITAKMFAHQSSQSVKSFAHINGLDAQVYAY
jgi:hypothetical protein